MLQASIFSVGDEMSLSSAAVLAGFPLVLKSPDFWRLKNQALKSPEIGHWS